MSHSNKSIPLGICRWCLKPDHPSGTMCPEHPDLMVPPKNVIEAEDYESAAPDGEPTTKRTYYGPCPQCGELLGFGHIPEECSGVAGDAVPLTPEPDLKRWTFFYRSEHLPEGMSPRPDGQWIKYEDFLAVTAHKEAEIAQLREKLEFEKQRQNEGYKIPALEAEVERLRKGIEAIEGCGMSAVAINCKLRELLGEREL